MTACTKVRSEDVKNYSRHESGLEIVCEGEKVKKNRDLGFQPK